MSDADLRWMRVAFTAIGTCLALITIYVLDLVRCAFLHDAPDPALLGEPGPSAYFARIIGCGIATPFLVGLLWMASRGREQTALTWSTRALMPAVIIASILVVVLA